MEHNQEDIDDSGAVVVCGHVASGQYSILYAERSESDDPVDSGWQFLCNSGLDEDIDQAKMWSINEVLDMEPGIRPFLDNPSGTILIRESTSESWEIEEFDPGDPDDLED